MMICPYCGDEAKLVTGQAIYPHRPDLFGKKFWSCVPCDAYVGCHAPNKKFGYGNDTPLGRLADPELRRMKIQVHDAFDPLWRTGQFKSRKAAYVWLADAMNLSQNLTHIGMFDVWQCEQAIKAVRGHVGVRNNLFK